MFSKISITKYTENYYQQINRLNFEIDANNTVLVGAVAGFLTLAGLTYSDERFMKYFSYFHQKYGINDTYSGDFYPYKTLKEYRTWWSHTKLISHCPKCARPITLNLQCNHIFVQDEGGMQQQNAMKKIIQSKRI